VPAAEGSSEIKKETPGPLPIRLAELPKKQTPGPLPIRASCVTI
jgi:hypothetical protein